jgi:hypothetical protein
MALSRALQSRDRMSVLLGIWADWAVRSTVKSVSSTSTFVLDVFSVAPRLTRDPSTVTNYRSLRYKRGLEGARSSQLNYNRLRNWVLCCLFIFSALLLFGRGRHRFFGQFSQTWVGDPLPLIGRLIIPGSREDRWGSNVLHGFSLVAACMDCHESLNETFDIWRQLAGIDEIVLVDWSSNPPIHASIGGEVLEHVRIVRVSGETAWVPSRAYNLGVYLSKFHTVGVVDLDHPLPATFRNFSARPLSVIRKNGSHCDALYCCATDRGAGEQAYSRSLILSRNVWHSIGGYDERIPGQDWAHVELIGRLEKAGACPILMECSSIPKSKARSSRLLDWTTVQHAAFEEMNWLIVQDLAEWSGPGPDKRYVTSYAVVGKSTFPGSLPLSTANKRHLKVVTVQPLAYQLVGDQVAESAKSILIGRQLHDNYGMPWEMMLTMTFPVRERLLASVTSLRKSQRDELVGDHDDLSLADFEYDPPRFFVVHVMHGLGNRIRALISAMAFAQSTGRQLVVVWESDEHCRANFVDLFEIKAGEQDIIVIDELPLEWRQFNSAGQHDAIWRDWILYNYMEMDGHGAVKDQTIQDVPQFNIYFKSAYVIVGNDKRLTGWDMANTQLKLLRPAVPVSSLVASTSAFMNLSSAIGVHIRSASLDMEKGIDPIRAYGKDETDVLTFWRSYSDQETFFTEMRKIIHQDSSATFFVASDNVTAVDQARVLFPGHAFALKRESCDSRATACLQIALADMILLSKTRLLLGSPWSSFTEVAQRFGGKKTHIAGIDFGREAGPSKQSGPAVASMLKRVRARRSRRASNVQSQLRAA